MFRHRATARLAFPFKSDLVVLFEAGLLNQNRSPLARVTRIEDVAPRLLDLRRR